VSSGPTPIPPFFNIGGASIASSESITPPNDIFTIGGTSIAAGELLCLIGSSPVSAGTSMGKPVLDWIEASLNMPASSGLSMGEPFKDWIKASLDSDSPGTSIAAGRVSLPPEPSWLDSNDTAATPIFGTSIGSTPPDLIFDFC